MTSDNSTLPYLKQIWVNKGICQIIETSLCVFVYCLLVKTLNGRFLFTELMFKFDLLKIV